jgi:hypothetical protein
MQRSVPTPAPSVVAFAVADEIVLLDERTGTIHLLNPTSAQVWRSLDARTSVAEVSRRMAAAYGVDLSVVAGSVADLVRRLADDGLVVCDATDAPGQEAARHDRLEADGPEGPG